MLQRSKPRQALLILSGWWGAASSGVSGLCTFSGTYLLVVALIAIVRGRVRWAHLRTRAGGAAALGAAVGHLDTEPDGGSGDHYGHPDAVCAHLARLAPP